MYLVFLNSVSEQMYLVEYFPILDIYTYFSLVFFFAWSLGFCLLHGFQNSVNFRKNLSSLCSTEFGAHILKILGISVCFFVIYVFGVFVLRWFKKRIIWKTPYVLCFSLLPVRLRRYVFLQSSYRSPNLF